MFGLVKRIFNVEVRPADGEAEVWNDDVSFFKVYDVDSGKHIASFYLDPYSRPENKRGGAWMDVCIGKREAVKRDVPVAYLTCNGSPPVGDKPSSMTFREVETLFHEAGHGLQHMLTTVNDHRLGVADFQEPALSANLDLVEALKPIAEREGATLPQLAIAWVMRRSEVTAAIVGARRPDQVRETALASDVNLSEHSVTEIDALIAQRDAAIGPRSSWKPGD